MIQRRGWLGILVPALAFGLFVGCDMPGNPAGLGGNSPPKLAALQAVVKHLKKFPDRFAPDSEREAFNKELDKLIEEFDDVPFSAKEDPGTVKKIVELFERDIERKFSGHLYNILDGHVRDIYSESLNR